MSSQLVWELIRKNHAFIRTSVNHTTFSGEPGNLSNKHSCASLGRCLLDALSDGWLAAMQQMRRSSCSGRAGWTCSRGPSEAAMQGRARLPPGMPSFLRRR